MNLLQGTSSQKTGFLIEANAASAEAAQIAQGERLT